MSILNKIGSVAKSIAPIAGIFNPVVGAAMGAGGNIAQMADPIDTSDPSKSAIKKSQIDPNMSFGPQPNTMASQISDPIATTNPANSPGILQPKTIDPYTAPEQASPLTPKSADPAGQADLGTANAPTQDALLNTSKYSQWSNALAFGQQGLNLVSGIWNATRQPNELPQTEDVKLDRVDFGTEAMQANMQNTINSNTANQIASSRGMGFGANEMSAVMGNKGQQELQAAAAVQGVVNQERDRNAEIQRTEEMTNVGQRNQRSLENANMLNNFDMQRGAMLTQNLSNIGSIERDRMNTQMNLDSLNKLGNYNNLNEMYDNLVSSGSEDLLDETGKVMSRDAWVNKRMSLYRR